MRVPLLIIAICATAATRFAWSQDETARFKANVTDVHVDVDVREGKRPVMGLRLADFRVLDEGEPQTLVYCGQEAVGVDLVLLLDVSGSVQRALPEIRSIAKLAAAQMRPADRLGVMAFSGHAQVLAPLTADAEQIDEALNRITRGFTLGFSTRINAAVISAAQYMRNAAVETDRFPGPRRRAVLAITDNQGFSFYSSSKAAVRSLLDSDASLNGIVVGARPHPMKVASDFEVDDVFQLASETGGEAVKASHPADRLKLMMEHIRGRYSLIYHAPPGQPGAHRTISVSLAGAARLRHASAELRARSGYYVNRE